MKIKKLENGFTTSEVIILGSIFLLLGLSFGFLFFKKDVVINKGAIYDNNLREFISSYEFVTKNYYEDVDKKKIINGAINGMMEALDDPYSVYFDENETNNFSITLDGSYKGIGVQINKLMEDGNIIVLSVFKNSPAANAGMKVGDEIVSVDELKSSDITPTEFSSYVRNSDKDEFEFTILRNGETIKLTLNKSVVELDSVLSKTFDVDNKKVGYIYIGIFANNTYEQFKRALKELEENNISDLIIDVRSDTGGHLTAVDGILDLFLSSNQIMYQFEQGGKITSIHGIGDDKKEYNIILLGDEYSASASEVLISSLKENIPGTVFIGKKTYGKGTVQELVTLSDGTQYKITTKKWLTPKGNWINDTEGIVPDIEVDLDEKYGETGSDEDDSQLQRALKYIKDGK